MHKLEKTFESRNNENEERVMTSVVSLGYDESSRLCWCNEKRLNAGLPFDRVCMFGKRNKLEKGRNKKANVTVKHGTPVRQVPLINLVEC